MLLLTKVNCNFLKHQRFVTMTHEKGMVLLVVLWIMMLTSLLMSHLVYSNKLNTQLARGALFEMQQFEAVEAALLRGEKELAQKVFTTQNIATQSYFKLPSETYNGYLITLEAIRLPHPFCILPMHQTGYYYELTARLQPKTSFSTSTLCLKSTLLLPSSEGCSTKLLKRPIGRSAWCEIFN